ncbi:hypothetical protein TIFTF001_031156 [Ficus carica]|uniref:Uncharacterized protein n=1 Tax=Ficus carica TaxID=3494 RepID=A0AA88DVU3_FICCA|nr:hypothetical protein TIFTF001_031156 [Ficus carica]
MGFPKLCRVQEIPAQDFQNCAWIPVYYVKVPMVSNLPAMLDVRLWRDGTADSGKLCRPVNGITARAGFGKKSGDVEVLEMISGMRRELLKLHGEIDEVLDKIINVHEEKKMIFGEKGHDHDDDQEDLVDVLLRLQKNGDLDPPLTASNIRAILLSYSLLLVLRYSIESTNYSRPLCPVFFESMDFEIYTLPLHQLVSENRIATTHSHASPMPT